MTATFRIRTIEYNESNTRVVLSMGDVGSGDVGMGVSAEIHLSGIEAIDARIPRPGTTVLLTIERVPASPSPRSPGTGGGE